jgi:hypothetical protein
MKRVRVSELMARFTTLIQAGICGDGLGSFFLYLPPKLKPRNESTRGPVSGPVGPHHRRNGWSRSFNSDTENKSDGGDDRCRLSRNVMEFMCKDKCY